MKTVEVTEAVDVRVSRRKMLHIQPQTAEFPNAVAEKIVDQGAGNVVEGAKAPPAKPEGGKEPKTTTHQDVKG